MWCTNMWSIWKSVNLKLWEDVDEVVHQINTNNNNLMIEWPYLEFGLGLGGSLYYIAIGI